MNCTYTAHTLEKLILPGIDTSSTFSRKNRIFNPNIKMFINPVWKSSRVHLVWQDQSGQVVSHDYIVCKSNDYLIVLDSFIDKYNLNVQSYHKDEFKWHMIGYRSGNSLLNHKCWILPLN